MTIDANELMEAVQIICNESNVRVTVKQSAKGAVVCGLSSLAGGLLLGPVGLAVGGTFGGLAAYKMSSGTFLPLAEILARDITEEQRERLINHVRNAVRDARIEDAAILLPLILQNASIKQAILNTVISFAANELQMQIVD